MIRCETIAAKPNYDVVRDRYVISMVSDNVKTRIKLQRVLGKLAREKSSYKHYPTGTEADNVFSNRPFDAIQEFNGIKFTVGKEKEEKTIVIDDWGLFEAYPTRDGIIRDTKTWKGIGHVEENPRVKFIIKAVAYGQREVGKEMCEIFIIGNTFIKDTVEIISPSYGYPWIRCS